MVILNKINEIKRKCPDLKNNSRCPILQSFIKKVFDNLTEIRPSLKHHWSNSRVIWSEIDKYNSIKSNLKEELPNNIKDSINKNIHYVYEYNAEIKNKIITITFYSMNKESSEIIEKKVILILFWLSYALTCIKNKCSNKLNIYLFDLPNKKRLPLIDNHYLKPENVNTAFTYSCKPNNEIVIFRSEEWFKVFLHETFHSFGIDFVPYSSQINQNVNNIFGLNINYDITESWCETWARIFNVIFVSYFESDNFDNFNLFKKYFNIRYTNEVIYSLLQMNKIINFYNLNMKSILLGKETNKYKEDTPVFSYFVLTSLNLLNTREFLYWCNEYNKPLFYFGFNFEKLKNYLIYIKKIISVSLTNKDLDCIIKYSKSKTKKNKNLRMTINEINLKN